MDDVDYSGDVEDAGEVRRPQCSRRSPLRAGARDWLQRPWFRAVYLLVLAEVGVLIAYAGIARKRVEHAGEAHSTTGLSDVYAYSAFRRQGHGRRVTDAATALIRASAADVGLFVRAPGLTRSYAAGG